MGDFGQGGAYLERLLEVARLSPSGPIIEYALMAYVIPLAARITGVVDRFDVAETAAEAVLSSPSAIPIFSLPARSGLALMAVQRDDAAAAGEQYASLHSERGTIFVPGIHTDRLLGLVAQTMGRVGEAMAHFEDALAFCRAGYRPEYAWSACDYADALLQRNGPDDRTKAMSLLDEGLSISREIGMRPLMERILSRKEILKA